MFDEPGRVTRRGVLRGALVAAAAAVGRPGRGAAGADAVNPRLATFVGGSAGEWSVVSAKAVTGDPLPVAARVDIVPGSARPLPGRADWVLRGVTSHERYVTRAEKEQLAAKQVPLGRPDATHGALIPIRKSAKWWALTQDERRAIFQEQSRHVSIGLKYLPAIARRLYHCRDLGESQPFDFVTQFDYAEKDRAAFDRMLAALRSGPEWGYVEREVDIRLVRAAPGPGVTPP